MCRRSNWWFLSAAERPILRRLEMSREHSMRSEIKDTDCTKSQRVSSETDADNAEADVGRRTGNMNHLAGVRKGMRRPTVMHWVVQSNLWRHLEMDEGGMAPCKCGNTLVTSYHSGSWKEPRNAISTVDRLMPADALWGTCITYHG